MKTIIMALGLFGLLACSNNNMKSDDMSIRTVAGEYVKDLYQDGKIDFFKFDLPPDAVVPDHSTGPRVLILLTDLVANRLADGSEVKASIDQVLYLSNGFSAGFKNSAKPAAYLVLGLKSDILMEGKNKPCSQAAMTQLFSQDDLVVCKSATTFDAEITQTRLLYRQRYSSVKKLKPGKKVTVQSGDILLEFSGNLRL